jgi:membrane associated rhomboid family serine protease
VFLPLWFVQQLYFASLTPPEAGGVGFAAHAAGFGFGVIAALVHQATGLQKRTSRRTSSPIREAPSP